nr:immunoglobulin light chain junction region [Macaca mulatta]MOY01055.1 immunoglobulin light chain junction region [Macaca mulatta]
CMQSLEFPPWTF